MRQLNKQETEQVAGGVNWVVAAIGGAMILAGELINKYC